MNRKVGFVIQQRLFQFLDEHSLAAHFRQRLVQKPISNRLYGPDPDTQAGMCFLQAGAYELRLPQGKRTFSRNNTQH